MCNLKLLALALVFSLILVPLTTHGSATRVKPSNYAPGEVIVKLKAEAPELRSIETGDRLLAIARLAGDREGLSERSAEPLAWGITNPRVSQIISQRGLDRTFVLKDRKS